MPIRKNSENCLKRHPEDEVDLILSRTILMILTYHKHPSIFLREILPQFHQESPFFLIIAGNRKSKFNQKVSIGSTASSSIWNHLWLPWNRDEGESRRDLLLKCYLEFLFLACREEGSIKMRSKGMHLIE